MAEVQSGVDSTPFARFVWQQGRRGVGVPVLLFTDAKLAATGAGGSAPVVTAAAERAGLDPARVELFSPEAYVLQGALAAVVLPGLGPSDDPAPVPAGQDLRSEPGPLGPLTAPWTPAHGTALLAAPVLALNFHAIPRDDRATVRGQLERIAAYGPALALDPPPGPDADPQVLVGFYDGFRDEGLWGAQVCAELGLRACFFPVFDHGPGSERVELLTYGDLEQIGRGHTVGFHSATHRRAAEVGPADLQREVHDPLDAIAAATGRPVTVAAWRRGTRFDPDTLADRVLRQRGVRHVVSNWSVEAVRPG